MTFFQCYAYQALHQTVSRLGGHQATIQLIELQQYMGSCQRIVVKLISGLLPSSCLDCH
jgi:hypothetical protein